MADKFLVMVAPLTDFTIAQMRSRFILAAKRHILIVLYLKQNTKYDDLRRRSSVCCLERKENAFLIEGIYATEVLA
jgi:hypothetical protein